MHEIYKMTMRGGTPILIILLKAPTTAGLTSAGFADTLTNAYRLQGDFICRKRRLDPNSSLKRS